MVETVVWRLRRDRGRVTLSDGRELYLNPIDPGISRELAVYRTHEPDATNMLGGWVNEGQVICDLGANLGYYSSLFLARLGATGSLVCIEPAPANVALLRRNIAMADRHGISRLVEAAVGRVSGRASLYLAPESNWHSLHARTDHTGTVDVMVWSLDDLAAHLNLKRLDLVRMDIEGQEVDVLAGMKEVLRRFRPKLVIEMHPQLIGSNPVKKCLKALMRDYGYEVVAVMDRELDNPWVPARKRLHPDFHVLMESDLSSRCFTVFMQPVAKAISRS